MAVLIEELTRELNSLKNVTSSSWQSAVDRLYAWDDRLVNNISNSMNASFHVWLLNHPVLSWLIHHPWISFLAISFTAILLIRLLVTIYRSIASTIDRMWLGILRSPFLLVKFLFGWEIKSQNNPGNTNITNYEVTHNPEQLQEIMVRLETIQQQQQQIMQDLALLKQQTAEPKQVKLRVLEQEKLI